MGMQFYVVQWTTEPPLVTRVLFVLDATELVLAWLKFHIIYSAWLYSHSYATVYEYSNCRQWAVLVCTASLLIDQWVGTATLSMNIIICRKWAELVCTASLLSTDWPVSSMLLGPSASEVTTVWCYTNIFIIVIIIIYCTTTATFLRPLYRSTGVSRHLQLRTAGFCWCKVLLATCRCWR